MYARKTKDEITDVDFEAPEDNEELFYWRKHPNLHGWMETLYRIKGGKDKDFNQSTLKLTPEDIDLLEKK